jgi:hypothetical protein
MKSPINPYNPIFNMPKMRMNPNYHFPKFNRYPTR